MGTKTGEFGREGAVFSALWSNVQHNENVRNRFFQFYLVIAGSFLVFFQKNGDGDHTGSLLFSIFVWVIGFSFLWTYERLREMIARDVEMIRHVFRSLDGGSAVEQAVLAEHEQYYTQLATTSQKWWSPTTSISSATNLIGALVLTVGVSHVVDLSWWHALVLCLLIIILTQGIVRTLNRAVAAQARRETRE